MLYTNLQLFIRLGHAYYLYKKKQVLIGNWPGEKPRLLCKKSAKGKKEQIKSVLFSGEFRDNSTGQSHQLDARVAIPYLTNTPIRSPRPPSLVLSAQISDDFGPAHQPLMVNNDVHVVQCARTPRAAAECDVVTGLFMGGRE